MGKDNRDQWRQGRVDAPVGLQRGKPGGDEHRGRGTTGRRGRRTRSEDAGSRPCVASSSSVTAPPTRATFHDSSLPCLGLGAARCVPLREQPLWRVDARSSRSCPCRTSPSRAAGGAMPGSSSTDRMSSPCTKPSARPFAASCPRRSHPRRGRDLPGTGPPMTPTAPPRRRTRWQRDPIILLRQHILDDGLVSEAERRRPTTANVQRFEAAISFAETIRSPSRKLRSSRCTPTRSRSDDDRPGDEPGAGQADRASRRRRRQRSSRRCATTSGCLLGDAASGVQLPPARGPVV